MSKHVLKAFCMTAILSTTLGAAPSLEVIANPAIPGAPSIASSTVVPQSSLIEISHVNSKIVKDIRLATVNNATGKAIYTRADCYVHMDTAKALVKVQNELDAMGLSLKIYDAYRPLSVQKTLWAEAKNEHYCATPSKEPGGHPRGTAVDVTLVDKNGAELEMPTAYGDIHSKDIYKAEAKLSATAKHNVALLKRVMTKHGFAQSEPVWWHFELVNSSRYPLLDLNYPTLETTATKVFALR